MSDLRILHVSPLYTPALGGGEVFVAELSEALSSFGHRVNVWTARAQRSCNYVTGENAHDLLRNDRIGGIQVRRFHFMRRLGTFLKAHERSRVVKRCLRWVFKTDPWIVTKHMPLLGMICNLYLVRHDIIAVTNANFCLFYYCCAAKALNARPLVYIPFLHTTLFPADHPLVTAAQRADGIIALTEHERDWFVSEGISPERIFVTGAGINPNQFRSAKADKVRASMGIHDSPVIAYEGRLAARKGIQTLVSAMSLVLKDFPDAHLILAGASTPYTDKLKQLIGLLPEEKRRQCHLIRDFADGQKADLYAACDIFAMPSVADSFGIAYLEAWLSGKPVIACNKGAPAEVVEDGRDGVHVPHGDVPALASGICQLLRNPGKAAILGANGRQKVLNNYTWPLVARKVESAYFEIVNRFRREGACCARSRHADHRK